MKPQTTFIVRYSWSFLELLTELQCKLVNFTELVLKKRKEALHPSSLQALQEAPEIFPIILPQFSYFPPWKEVNIRQKENSSVPNAYSCHLPFKVRRNNSHWMFWDCEFYTAQLMLLCAQLWQKHALTTLFPI